MWYKANKKYFNVLDEPGNAKIHKFIWHVVKDPKMSTDMMVSIQRYCDSDLTGSRSQALNFISFKWCQHILKQLVINAQSDHLIPQSKSSNLPAYFDSFLFKN